MTVEVTFDRKRALKELREQRASTIDVVQQRVKEQNRIRKELVAALKEGPLTVPDVALATGIPTETVLWHLMAMKKYGKVVEVDQEGDYYRYQLAEK